MPKNNLLYVFAGVMLFIVTSAFFYFTRPFYEFENKLAYYALTVFVEETIKFSFISIIIFNLKASKNSALASAISFSVSEFILYYLLYRFQTNFAMFLTVRLLTVLMHIICFGFYYKACKFILNKKRYSLGLILAGYFLHLLWNIITYYQFR